MPPSGRFARDGLATYGAEACPNHPARIGLLVRNTVGSTRIGGLSAGEEGMYRYIIIRNKDQASQLERVKHGMPILTRPPTT